MNITFGGKSIADALRGTSEQISSFGQALKNKGAQPQVGERPTGYGRKIRRARQRADAAYDRKAARNRTRAQIREADKLETAGTLALIYFGEVEASDQVIAEVRRRVEDQAWALASAPGGPGPIEACDQVEASLRDSADRLKAAQFKRALRGSKITKTVVHTPAGEAEVPIEWQNAR